MDQYWFDQEEEQQFDSNSFDVPQTITASVYPFRPRKFDPETYPLYPFPELQGVEALGCAIRIAAHNLSVQQRKGKDKPAGKYEGRPAVSLAVTTLREPGDAEIREDNPLTHSNDLLRSYFESPDCLATLWKNKQGNDTPVIGSIIRRADPYPLAYHRDGKTHTQKLLEQAFSKGLITLEEFQKSSLIIQQLKEDAIPQFLKDTHSKIKDRIHEILTRPDADVLSVWDLQELVAQEDLDTLLQELDMKIDEIRDIAGSPQGSGEKWELLYQAPGWTTCPQCGISYFWRNQKQCPNQDCNAPAIDPSYSKFQYAPAPIHSSMGMSQKEREKHPIIQWLKGLAERKRYTTPGILMTKIKEMYPDEEDSPIDVLAEIWNYFKYVNACLGIKFIKVKTCLVCGQEFENWEKLDDEYCPHCHIQLPSYPRQVMRVDKTRFHKLPAGPEQDVTLTAIEQKVKDLFQEISDGFNEPEMLHQLEQRRSCRIHRKALKLAKEQRHCASK